MLLKKKYQLEGMDRSIKDTFLQGRGRAKFYFRDEFLLVKVISEEEVLFDYLLTGRIGSIRILFRQEGTTLFLETFETPLGFGVPILMFFLTILAYFKSPELMPFAFIFGVVWLLLIYFFFHSDSKDIRNSVEKFMRT